jgi:hypothetical protein
VRRSSGDKSLKNTPFPVIITDGYSTRVVALLGDKFQ